jgi:branched-chain amino acid transport system ATP-binding protein
MAFLEIESLCVAFGPLDALKDVSLSVGKGEIVAVLGANGAGKTTLLKTISGLYAPRSGRLSFDGRDLRSLPPHTLIRHGISHVPEGRRVFPTLTVEENLRLGVYGVRGMAAGKGYARNRDMAFELFPILKERARQFSGTLSGGEQQMLAIARGLVSKPRLLLLDEPSLGLAPIVIKDIFRAIKRIHEEEGITILLVEQNARQALSVSSRAYILELGAIAISGSSAQLANDERVREAYLGGKALKAAHPHPGTALPDA